MVKSNKSTSIKPPFQGLNLLAAVFLAFLILFLAGFLGYAWIVERNHKVNELSAVLRFCTEFTENYFERITAAHRRLSSDLLQSPKNWLRRVERLLVIEIGAGTDIPTVRLMSESVGGRLIRINPREPGLGGTQGISLPCGGLEALSGISAALPAAISG